MKRGPVEGPLRGSARRAGSGLRGRLDARVVLEELLVQLGEVLPLVRDLVLGEDRLHRAHGLAGAAVDALVRMDVEHGLALVDAVHGADLDAGLVLDVDARLGDHVRHGMPPSVVPPRVVRPNFSTRTCRRVSSARPHWVRSRGSRASRSESPNRLKANTARLIASPGKIAIQGAASANSTAAPRSISPHAAVGSCTPSPRNESEASSRIAWPRNGVRRIRGGPPPFGSLGRRITRRWPTPAARAASMYGISRIESA